MIGTLLVKVIKANLLINTDWFKKMDPYVVIKLNDSSSKTSYKNNAGKNPIWNETLVFRAQEDDYLKFEIMDADLLKKDDFVCSGAHQIKEIYSQKNKEVKIHLFYNSNSEAGDLFVEFHFYPDPSEYSKIMIVYQEDIKKKTLQIEKLRKELKSTNKLEGFEDEQKKRKEIIRESMNCSDRKENLDNEFLEMQKTYEIKIQELEKEIIQSKEEEKCYKEAIEKSSNTIQSIDKESSLFKNLPINGKINIICKDAYLTRKTSTIRMNQYLNFTLKNNSYKTKVIEDGKNNLNFDENFSLEREGDSNILCVEALDKCSMGSPNLIAYSNINLNFVISRGTQLIQSKFIYLEKEYGYINLEISFEKNK